MSNTISIIYEGEELKIDIVPSEHDLSYKLNFDHPVFIKRDVDADGVEMWVEAGVGETLRAKEIGEVIDNHPELL